MFCLADFVYLIQELMSNCLHFSNEYATIVVASARPLKLVNKISQIEL